MPAFAFYVTGDTDSENLFPRFNSLRDQFDCPPVFIRNPANAEQILRTVISYVDDTDVVVALDLLNLPLAIFADVVNMFRYDPRVAVVIHGDDLAIWRSGYTTLQSYCEGTGPFYEVGHLSWCLGRERIDTTGQRTHVSLTMTGAEFASYLIAVWRHEKPRLSISVTDINRWAGEVVSLDGIFSTGLEVDVVNAVMVLRVKALLENAPEFSSNPPQAKPSAAIRAPILKDWPPEFWPV